MVALGKHPMGEPGELRKGLCCHPRLVPPPAPPRSCRRPFRCCCRPEACTEGANPQVKFEVSIAVLHDWTVAVEVALSDGIINWPYFTDLSLVGARLRAAPCPRFSIARVWLAACLHGRFCTVSQVQSGSFVGLV